MDTDVLVVGAGPTGLMLANQLVRRGVRTLIIDRHAGPSLQTRALGVQARTLEIYAKLGIVDRALELGKRGTGANMWAQGRKMARVPLGEAGPKPHALSVHSHPRPGRQRTDHGRQASRPGRFGAVEHGAGRPRAATRQGRRNAQAARRHQPDDPRRVGRRMRRRAQRRARVERHYLPGRALRARVLRRRCGGDGQHGSGRGQHLPVAGRLSSVVPHAREGSLADRRHPAARLCATGTTSHSRP